MLHFSMSGKWQRKEIELHKSKKSEISANLQWFFFQVCIHLNSVLNLIAINPTCAQTNQIQLYQIYQNM